jgi:putative DNA primase/helicase
MVWPDTPPDWRYVDRSPDAAAEKQAERIFRRLIELDVENPKTFRFTPEAQQLFVEWLAEQEAKIRGNELHPALISHLSKYRSLMPALALLFELTDWSAGTDGTVSLQHAKQAAAWCDYLESHARRIYSCVVTPAIRGAQELALKLKSRKGGLMASSPAGMFIRRDGAA